jgi:hypothetical protein
MKDVILADIRRIATENGGLPPGRKTFENLTGISAGKWCGVYWARWSEALAEAGFAPNAMISRRDSDDLLRRVADLCRNLGKMPTTPDMRLYARSDPTFPNDKTVAHHFGRMADLVAALRTLATTPEYQDIAPLLPAEKTDVLPVASKATTEGAVYLLRSGQHYKIGRSDQIEQRVKKITVALPEAATLVHTIRTDDAPGIETYWHRRFADRRLNGEWFRLTAEDVKAFRRRTFQ